jgi:predicted dehydrogenase
MSALKVGIAGFGFMGRKHYQCWRALEGVEVTAVCDVNPNIVQETKKVLGNIATGSEEIDFDSLETYADFGKMLAEAKLDAVSITMPTDLHADYTVKALSAGVNVLCEKPMSLNVNDCRRMITEAKRSKKHLQIGHCIRFWPEYAKAKEIVDSGRYGKVVAATFRRLGAVPNWSSDNWLLDEKRSGGMALDLHIHDTDFVQYLFGLPCAVCSFGVKDATGELIHIVTEYLYDDGKVITAEGGWAMMPTFGFEMSFDIMMEKATLVYNLTRRPVFKVCPAEGEAFVPELEENDGWFLQIAQFAKKMSGEKVREVTTLEQSINSVRIVEAEKKSIAKERRISIG